MMWAMRKRWRWLVGAAAIVVVLALGAPFVYIHFIEGPPPPKLTLPTTPLDDYSGLRRHL